MAQPPDIGGISQAQLRELGLLQQSSAKLPNKELGQSEFFDLMVAQLKFQDPLKPLANTEFVAQMAQFSSLNSLEAVQSSLGDLVSHFQSSQALQASTLVGRKVLVPSDVAVRTAGETVGGAIELPNSSPSVSVSIFDASGQLVRSMDLGSQPAGRVAFTWDGADANGDPVPPGAYRVQADAQVGQGRQALQTLAEARVDSVSLAQNPPGVTLNLAGQGSVGLDAVKALLD